MIKPTKTIAGGECMLIVDLGFSSAKFICGESKGQGQRRQLSQICL